MSYDARELRYADPWIRIARAEEEIERQAEQLRELREALQRIKNELGVPDDDYPAPVSNAWDIANSALSQSEGAE